jgi:steroid 5-alpha reductase family enzyme
MDLKALLLTAGAIAIALSAIMLCAWQAQRKTGHTGWIDVLWTCGVGAVAILGCLAPMQESGTQVRQVAVAGLAGLWSFRLAGHIFRRTRAVGDDPRYRHWINQWGATADRRMFWHLQLQAAFGVLLGLCIVLAGQNPHAGLRPQDILGVSILLTGIVGETVADRQMRQYRVRTAGTKGICDIGLWRFSRHPNYFFEWLCWCAYPVIAMDMDGSNAYGWVALAAPVCMYWLLTAVSGIPPLEEHMLRTRGEAYRAYQRRTSAFFPIRIKLVWLKPGA